MSQTSGFPKSAVFLAGVVFVGSIGYLFFQSKPSNVEKSESPQNGVVLRHAELDSDRVSELQHLTAALSGEDSNNAAKELRAYLDQIVTSEKEVASHALILVVNHLESNFEMYQPATQQFAAGLVGDVIRWNRKHPPENWAGVLSPTRDIILLMLESNDHETRISGLHIAQSILVDRPTLSNGVPEAKAVNRIESDLVSACGVMLDSDHDAIRFEAARVLSIVDHPDTTAGCLAVLFDEAETTDVRRAILLGMADREEALPSEDVIGFLNHPRERLGTTANLVLSTRGLSRAEISLATQATHPSPLVRSQAPHHIVQSQRVDPEIWLTHLSHDREVVVRTEVVKALSTLQSSSSTDRLVEIAAEDPDPTVRELAQQVLRKRTLGSAEKPAVSKRSRPVAN